MRERGEKEIIERFLGLRIDCKLDSVKRPEEQLGAKD
jgi:hypothetical protein